MFVSKVCATVVHQKSSTTQDSCIAWCIYALIGYKSVPQKIFTPLQYLRKYHLTHLCLSCGVHGACSCWFCKQSLTRISGRLPRHFACLTLPRHPMPFTWLMTSVSQKRLFEILACLLSMLSSWLIIPRLHLKTQTSIYQSCGRAASMHIVNRCVAVEMAGGVQYRD